MRHPNLYLPKDVADRSRLYRPKESLIQFPSLWLPGSPLPSSRGMPGYPCCCGGCGDGFDCDEFCIDGNAPAQLEVEMIGLTNESCSDCDDLNGTYVLDCEGEATGCSFGCNWWHLLESPACGIYSISCSLFTNGLLVIFSTDDFPSCGGLTSGGFNYIADPGDPADCMNWSSLALSLVSSFWSPCTHTGATCTVTSL